MAGPYAYTAADAAAAIGLSLMPLDQDPPAGSKGRIRLTPVWEGEQVAESPYQRFIQVDTAALRTSCCTPCTWRTYCGDSEHLKSCWLRLCTWCCKRVQRDVGGLDLQRMCPVSLFRLRPQAVRVQAWSSCYAVGRMVMDQNRVDADGGLLRAGVCTGGCGTGCRGADRGCCEVGSRGKDLQRPQRVR